MWQVINQHELLKARLHERGSSFAAVARELGVHPSAVTHVAKRKHKLKRPGFTGE
ncbi:helix-turn-helix domain-containing protein [Paracoccus saliphilus]|uniref:CENP-B N-terminal DNA-binding domain-containing protein n=1 Tax=Paracoccus saliphilus TaxID=405559 RepID=A0AA45W6M6_9RHOB|nr:CENP-B N-terminal DNA-binding domain-containing protein [Paracoccus saliphilus]